MAGNELRAVITVDAKNAAFTIDKFVGQTVGGMGQAATASKGAASAFGSLGGAAIALNQGLQLVQQAGRLAASAFDLLVGGAQRTGEQYLLLSQQTGLTVEEISAMSVAAATAGVSNEALALTTKKLSVNMVDSASGGKESTATFKALGVEIKNADGTLRNVNDVFLDTIDALGQIETEVERTAASQAAFGRSSQELAALIADGSDKIRAQAELAAKLALVWSGPAAQAADELGDQTTILGLALKGMGDEIGAKSIPSMTQLVSATNDWIVKNREAISQNIDRIFAAAATAADTLADAAHGVGGAIDDVVNSIPGLRGSLGTIRDLAVEWLDLQVQARAAAKATDDTGRAFIAASQALTTAKQAQADYNLAIRDAGQLYPDQIAKQKALDQAVLDAQAAYDTAEAALDRNVTTTQQAASATDFLVSSLATLKDKSTLSAAAQAQFAKDVGISVEEVKRLDEGGKPTAETIQKIATATGKTTAEIERALPGQRSFADGMKKTDDEAIKTAQSLAQLAGQSAQYAQSQLQQAAATGDLTATTDAYVEAMAKAGEAYQASQKAADAAAAAGKSATEVAAMRTQAEQQLSTAVNAAAASQATAYAREEAAQSSLAHALGQSAIAHDMQALSMANANEVADAYSKTLVDIAAELKRTTDEINSKRGVTLTAAEADKLLADANEKAAQQISAAGAAAVQAAGKMSEFAQSVQAASDRAAQAFADLATRIVTGSVSFKDAGKAAAQIFLNAFQDVLSDTLGSVFKSAFDSLLGLGGGGGGILGGLLSGLGAKFASEIPNVIGPSIAAAGSNQAVLQGALQFGGSTASSMAGSLGSALATAGPLAAVAVGAGIFVDGIRNMVSGDMEKGLMEAAIAVPVVGVPAIIVSKLLDAFGVTGPDMRKRIAVFVETQLTQALSQDTNYLSALETGLTPLGIAITPALVQTLAGASRQNDALRAQAAILADQYGADFMAGFSPAFTASINKHGASSASVPVSDWIRAFFPDADAASQAYAQELAKSLASVEVASMGLTGADAITYTEQLAAGYVDLAQKQGLSIDQFVAMLEVQNQAAGMSTQFLASLDQLNAGLSTQKGALDEVAAGISAAFGVPVSGSNLVDMFIQVAGATGDAGKAAEIFTAKIQAMAAEDPALRALVDSMDPPLVDALHAVADGATTAADAFRDLVGTVAADLTNVVDAANILIGNVSFEGLTDQLASLKDQLAHTDDSELAAKLEHDIAAVEAQLDALSPKVDVINSRIQDSLRSLVSAAEQDGTLAVDEFTAMLQELQILATLPAGTVSDSTQALIDQIIAQFQVALKLTDEQVADLRAQIEAGGPIVPPEVVTPPVDQAALDAATTATDGLTTSTTDAKTATDDLTTSLQDLGTQAAGLAGAGGQTITDALGLTPEAAAAVTNITAGLSTEMATATDGLATSTTGAKTATDDLTTSLQDLQAQAAGLAGGQTITDALGLTPEAAAAVTNITAGLSTEMATATDGLATSTTGAKTATDDLTTSLQDLQAQAAGLAGGQTITDALGLTPEAAAAVTNITAGLSTAASGATEMATATDGLTTSTTDAAAATSELTNQINNLIAQGTTLGATGASVTEALGLTPEAAAAVTNITAGLSTAASGATEMATATDGLTTSTTDAAAATSELTNQINNLIAQGTTLGATGASVTEALGLTPEAAAAVTNITAGLSTAASGATDMAAAVQQVTESVSGSTDEFAALAQAAGMSSDQVQAALAMVVGAVDDGKSLEAVAFKLDSITQFLPAEMVPSFQGSFDSANASVSSTFTKVGELQSALTTLAGNYDITVTTHYVTDGEPPTTPTPDTGHAAGHWTVPGPQGAPYRTTVHGGEEVLSVEQSRDYRRTMRERALDGLDARAGSTVVVPVPEARAPVPGDVAGEVVDRLTQGGRLHLFVASEVDAQKLGRSMLLSNVDELIRSGAITGAALKRNPARPS